VSLRNLFWFYRLRLKSHTRLVQELFALAGIAVGVALLFAVQVSSSSLDASIAQVTDRIVGDAQLQLVARGPQGFDQHVAEEVARLPGVRVAAPVLQAHADAAGPVGRRSVVLLAATPELARLGGNLLTAFTDVGQLPSLEAIVVPRAAADSLGVRLGSRMILKVNGHARRVQVGGVATERDVGPLADAPAVVAPLAYGQQLADLSKRVTRVYVLAESRRTAEVEAGLRRIAGDGIDVRSAGSDGDVFRQAATPNDQSAALYAGISAFVGFLFAFNAMALMAPERRGIIADLRMNGYNLPGVLQVLLFDALLLGAVASVIGLALGDQLSRHIFQPSPGYLEIAFPVGSGRTVHWWTVALAFACGMAASVVATLPPLLAAARAPAMDATEVDDKLDPDDSEPAAGARWRLTVAGICLAATTVVFFAAPKAALGGIVLLALAMLLALPAILRGVLGLLDRLRRRIKGVAPAIAMGELMSVGSHSVAIAAVAAVAVFSYTAIEGAHGDLQRGLDPNAYELNAVTDLWVAPAGYANTLSTTPFRAASVIKRLDRLPIVRSVSIYRGSFLDMGNRRVWVIAPPRESSRPIPWTQVVDGDLVEATRRLRGEGWVAMSEAVADQQGLKLGDRFTLDSPRPTRVQLAAITTNFGWAPGAMVLNADDYRRAWGTDDASALHVELRDGVSQDEGRQVIGQALGPASGLAVETPRLRELRDRRVTRQGLARLTQIARLVLLAAALAMAAAMSGMIWQRRRHLADLKLNGITHRELWRALLLESALLIGIGCGVGAVFGIYGQQVLDKALNRVTGFPVDDSFGVLVALTTLAVVTTVACVIAMLPGWLAARVPADVALRD
jgi:putative ABC transport system permease protein